MQEAIVLARFGGEDLALAMNQLFAARSFSPSLAQTIADAVSGKDSAPQYTLLMAMLEKRVASRARSAALGGGVAGTQLSELYADIIRHRAMTEAYGLDKRLEVGLLLRKLYAVLNL
ncbi:MAG: hypothetical protein HC779_01915 [Phyllobacteriaceae bacterium]|nr:hypothetical protein [Phyllobacteriaceae bacterium]